MGKGYDRATDVLEHSVLGISPAIGNYGARDSVRIFRQREGEKTGVVVPERFRWWWDRDEADKISGVQLWLNDVQLALQLQHGVDGGGWVRCPRTTMWCLIDPDQAKAIGRRPQLVPPLLCLKVTSRNEGRMTAYSVCGNERAPGGDRCKMHQGVVKRAEVREAQYRQERDQRASEWKRSAQLTADLRVLWARVCAQRDVMHPGDQPTVRTDGSAVVDGEVLMMLLRELDMEGGQ